MIREPETYLRSVKLVMREECIETLDYWCERGVDWEKGGLMTCLERDGTLWDARKPGWFQGRALFSFAKGYNDILKREQWLKACDNLYAFLTAHLYVPGDPHGKMYYMLDADGNGGAISPNLFSETFALMGIAEYYKATGRREALDRVRRIFDESLVFYYQNPKYLSTGAMSQEKEKCPLAWYMMLLCSVQTLRGCDPERERTYTDFLRQVCEDVFTYYYDPEIDMIVELEYDPPGHTCEVLWFMLAEGLYTKDQKLTAHMAKMVEGLFRISYDWKNGGIPMFKSYYGKPDRMEGWDIRRWWVEVELLLALMYAYAGTNNPEYLDWYRAAHEYVFARFPDREMGEWYGYLHADGTPITDLKGDEAKGPYHLPRCFIAIHNLLDAMGY